MPSHYIASSKRSSPQAISHSVSSVPKLFPTVSRPSTLSSLPCRSFPSELSPSYFHGLNAVSFPASEALPKLFPRFPARPACCLAPSQRSCPQAISTVSCPSSMLSRSLPAKLSAKAICTVSYPPSMLSRSLPAKLSPSYFHGFLSVQHAVSLPPSEALRTLFARFPARPACCLAPSQRSCPQAISTVSSPSSMLSRSLPAKLSAKAICTVSYPPSMLSRSLPAKLSPSYFHGFLSVQHAVSLPPSEAFRKLFARFPILPACCLASSQRSSPQAISMLSRSQRSFPQAICTVSCPSSILSRSLPPKLSASYLHGFLSVQHAVSLPPSEAFRKLFARFPLRPACCLAPSQRSFPQAICTVSSPSSMLSRSLPSFLPPFLPSLPLPSFLLFLPPFLPSFLLFLPPFLPSFLPSFSSFLPSFLPSFLLFPSLPSFSSSPSLPPFLPSFLLSFLPISDPSPSNTPSRSLAANVTKREPKHRRCFWEKTMGSLRKMLKTYGNPKLCLGKCYLYKLWNSLAFATNWKLTIFFG